MILFGYVCALLYFGPYTYLWLRIGPVAEELTNDQEYQETQEFYMSHQIHAHLWSNFLLGIAW